MVSISSGRQIKFLWQDSFVAFYCNQEYPYYTKLVELSIPDAANISSKALKASLLLMQIFLFSYSPILYK